MKEIAALLTCRDILVSLLRTSSVASVSLTNFVRHLCAFWKQFVSIFDLFAGLVLINSIGWGYNNVRLSVAAAMLGDFEVEVSVTIVTTVFVSLGLRRCPWRLCEWSVWWCWCVG